MFTRINTFKDVLVHYKKLAYNFLYWNEMRMIFMPRAVWFLIIGMFVNVTGNSFLWPLNTIFIHDYLGKSLTVAGLVLMANQGTGVVGNLLGGFLFDRIGGYKSILGGIGL